MHSVQDIFKGIEKNERKATRELASGGEVSHL